ncbi:MAG: HD-GYP domain-containing protein [Aureliella sp.]
MPEPTFTPKLDVAIGDLKVGQPLESDILDASGIVLLRRGAVLSQETVDGWIRRGFARVLLRPYSDDSVPIDPADAEAAKLLRPYDPVLLKQLDENFASAKQAVDDIVFQLTLGDDPDISTLEPVFHSYLSAIDTDVAAVLSSAASHKGYSEKRDRQALVTRCVQMSMLGAVTAATLGLSREECQAVATAGLLHDMALFDETLSRIQSDISSEEERREVLYRHSLYSAELFGRCHGVSDLVRVVITQVHEQVDGQGFPRGLPGHHMNTLSRILNIIDAYLTLIEPTSSQPAIVPSDAMAYLVNHTSNGAFDRDCMRAFVASASIYSVGSRVELDNAQTATVLRSSRTDPMRPIIRFDDQPQTIIDLTRSHLNVARPMLDPECPHRGRLAKSQMHAVLWKPGY